MSSNRQLAWTQALVQENYLTLSSPCLGSPSYVNGMVFQLTLYKNGVSEPLQAHLYAGHITYILRAL